ncbi:MAG: fatty acid desaturase [Rhodobacteraceae bacterium]|nr:fatty acid desaturase [Paracoccaceae bacterium]
MTSLNTTANSPTARDWVKILSAYRDPDDWRSAFELAVSLVPFVGLWALSLWLAGSSPWAAAAVSLVNGGFLVRLFCIQHDCGHGSFFSNRRFSNWVGRSLGVLTLTPYDVWRNTHSIHHSHAGDLDHRGIGDVMTLTLAEYRGRSPLWRWLYRLYRHPLVMFGLGPTFLFMIEFRLPLGLMNQRRYWLSAMGTNLALALALSVLVHLFGWQAVALAFLPSTIMAASVGVWLFYVQHQFETTHWSQAPDWSLHDAALRGSSHYDLPPVLRWFTANIGIHHVHHLYSRIPFYRLPQVLRDHGALAEHARMTLRESLGCARLDLWDEDSQRLISFAAAHAAPQEG